MPLVRILIDGYSLLHGWPELAPGKPRYSAAARDELLNWLQQYHDAIGTPMTVFFDGAGAPPGLPAPISTPGLEVLYSRAGKTADDMIERTTQRLLHYGEVLVVTDDIAERDLIFGLGANASSCLNFICDMENTLSEFKRDLARHNAQESRRFRENRKK